MPVRVAPTLLFLLAPAWFALKAGALAREIAPHTPVNCAAPLASSALPSVDCNANGVEDAVDIAVGYSSDLDGNGVPDECEGRRSN
jgi:hypothetical protein